MKLTVRAQSPRTFDVTINGVAVCTAIPTPFEPPFVGISVMDASNPGWGGKVSWDNFAY